MSEQTTGTKPEKPAQPSGHTYPNANDGISNLPLDSLITCNQGNYIPFHTKFREGEKLITLEQVIELTGLSRARIYDLMNKGEWPRPIPMSQRRVMWLLSECVAALSERVAKRNAQYSLTQHLKKGGGT